MAYEGVEERPASELSSEGGSQEPSAHAYVHDDAQRAEASSVHVQEAEAEVGLQGSTSTAPPATLQQQEEHIVKGQHETSAGDQYDAAEALVQRATPWLYYAAAQAQELKQTMAQSTDEAVKSARAQLGDLQQASSHHYFTLKDMFGRIEAQYKYHEDIFFTKLKEGIKVAHDHSTLSVGLASGAVLLLLRRPRRLLFRYTIGRFRSEEVMLTNAEKKVKEMRQSIDILQNESKKLEERVRLAEEELVRGQTKLKNAGSQIRSLVRTVFKTESHARGLVDNLRELPGRDALRLRAEVASMAAEAKQQRTALDKKLAKITKYGIPV